MTFSDEVVTSFEEHFTGSPTTIEAKDNMQICYGLLDAFDELEFRKAFLILNYIGRKKLEDVVSADRLQTLKMIKEMDRFEAEITVHFSIAIPPVNALKLLSSVHIYCFSCYLTVS